MNNFDKFVSALSGEILKLALFKKTSTCRIKLGKKSETVPMLKTSLLEPAQKKGL